MKRDTYFLVFILGILGLAACQESKTSDGKRQAAGDPQANINDVDLQDESGSERQSQQRSDVHVAIGDDATFLDAEFKVEVRTLGAPICEGTVNVRVNATIGKQDSPKLFDIPSGMIDCHIHKFDLAQILGGAMAKTPKIPIEESLMVRDSIIYMKQLGAGLYTPPRPVFPSFLASKKEIIRSIDQRVALRLDDQKYNKAANGEIRLKVNTLGVPYYLRSMGLNFPNTMQFALETRGFDGLNKPENFLFQKMEFIMSLAPIALLRLDFSGPVSDLASGASSVGFDIPRDNPGIVGGIVNFIGGLMMVDVSLELIKMKNLKEALENSGKPGPVIGP